MSETTIVTTPRELADEMARVEHAGGAWQVAGMPTAREDAVTLVLDGLLASVTAVGDGLVEVGGGVTLATLSQYLQSQVGVAPGWPLDAEVTVAGALADAAHAPKAIARIVAAMSEAVVEVEVMRASTRAAEVWPRSALWQHPPAVGLPRDSAVVSVTASVAAAGAAAVRPAPQIRPPGGAGEDGSGG